MIAALIATTLVAIGAAKAEFHWLFRQAKTPRLRSMAEFAEQEIVLPKGHYRRTLMTRDVQPFSFLLLDEIDTGRWSRIIVVGCVQSGKSTVAFGVVIVYYLVECNESVVIGAPTMIVCEDKYRKEIEPIFRASRYRDLLPTQGKGSQGGFAEEITLTTGAAMKFMAAKGGDERRSSYTARCIVLTEVDKCDTAGETSRETDPVSQMEARSLSYLEDERRFHAECTVSVPNGRIWKEYNAGTASRIACPCPHCGEHVTPEREHLVGWEDAESEAEARKKAYFCCPECGHRITAEERVAMNRHAKLIHKGQTIDEQGVIHGDLPATRTLGFRWNAFNNMFWSAAEIAAKEWNAKHATSGEEALEKELCQFYWSIPYQSPDFDATPLRADDVRRRFSQRRFTKGIVPSDAEQFVAAIDLGKRFCSWMAMASRPGCRRHFVEYGTFEVPSDSMMPDKALMLALRNFRDEVVLPGWQASDGDAMLPGVVFLDAGWYPQVVYEFCRESGNRFRPAIGYGLSQNNRRYRTYRKPSKTGTEVKLIGEEYHVVWSPKERLFRIDFNADYWKTQLFAGLRTPPADKDGNPNDGAVQFFYSPNANEHLSVAKQFTAEHPQEVFTPGVGTELKWIKDKKKNHHLDNASNNLVAAHLLGARLLNKPTPAASSTPKDAEESKPFLTPDGRPYLLTDRE
jgi:phage terminase large subunit GpA-like protein